MEICWGKMAESCSLKLKEKEREKADKVFQPKSKMAVDMQKPLLLQNKVQFYLRLKKFPREMQLVGNDILFIIFKLNINLARDFYLLGLMVIDVKPAI